MIGREPSASARETEGEIEIERGKRLSIYCFFFRYKNSCVGRQMIFPFLARFSFCPVSRVFIVFRSNARIDESRAPIERLFRCFTATRRPSADCTAFELRSNAEQVALPRPRRT